MSFFKLRLMRAADLEQVLQWRNHPKVSRFMYTNHEITLEEHKEWFIKANANPTIDVLIYEQGEKAQGFVSISRLPRSSSAVGEWGFYLAPHAPKGSGRELGKLALNHAFEKLRLHKLCGQSLGFNEKSIAFHKTLGFIEEGLQREQHYDGVRFHDVVWFGLLRNEWQTLYKD